MDSVEYFDDTHTYCVDGVIVPSASALVAFATGNIYSNIPEEILRRASEYGTAVHSAIQDFELTGHTQKEYETQIGIYSELKQKYLLNVKDMEQIINYKKHFCGRYDIRDIDGVLWDIKTTSKIHTENLEWQLGLYYLALGTEKDVGYAIWIPKRGKPRVELIKPKTNKECIELIDLYEKSIADGQN